MKIKTYSSYAKESTKNVEILFGKPYIRICKNPGSLVFVRCAVVAVGTTAGSGTFSDISLYVDLTDAQKRKAISYAKNLAEDHVKNRKWKLKVTESGFIQRNHFCGFSFRIK